MHKDIEKETHVTGRRIILSNTLHIYLPVVRAEASKCGAARKWRAKVPRMEENVGRDEDDGGKEDRELGCGSGRVINTPASNGQYRIVMQEDYGQPQ